MMINLQIQMPHIIDVEYSDEVYWSRWEKRQLEIEDEEDSFDDIPSDPWRAVWFDLNDHWFSQDPEDSLLPQPPQAGGYGGIDVFAASSRNPSVVMNEIVDQIHAMNGQVLLQELFSITWRAGVSTVLTAWLRSHGDGILVHIDLVDGNSYLDLILPMVRAMYLNEAFASIRPFNEEQWRCNAFEKMHRMHRIDA